MSYMISDMISGNISKINMHFTYFLCPAAADPPPAKRADETSDDREPDRPMDYDEVRDCADQGPLTDMDKDSSLRHGGRRRDSNATVEAHALLRTFGCIEWQCVLSLTYDMIVQIIVNIIYDII
jgi:hypothetical protein